MTDEDRTEQQRLIKSQLLLSDQTTAFALDERSTNHIVRLLRAGTVRLDDVYAVGHQLDTTKLAAWIDAAWTVQVEIEKVKTLISGERNVR